MMVGKFSIFIVFPVFISSQDIDESHKSRVFAALPSVNPLGVIGGEITLGFWPQIDPFTNKHFLHRGIDISNEIGSPIYVTATGVVKKVKWDHQDYGNYIIIEHKFNYTTLYWHLENIIVKESDSVKQGEKIGTLGDSGRVTGPHLQYDILIGTTYVNPEDYLDPITLNKIYEYNHKD